MEVGYTLFVSGMCLCVKCLWGEEAQCERRGKKCVSVYVHVIYVYSIGVNVQSLQP